MVWSGTGFLTDAREMKLPNKVSGRRPLFRCEQRPRSFLCTGSSEHMKNTTIERERRLITREFADTLAGKTPAPYLRNHDPVQRMLVETAAHSEEGATRSYLDRMIHFWREVSLAGMPRSGRGMDECYALLFEAAFDLAREEPEWAAETLSEKRRGEWPFRAVNDLWVRTPKAITHEDIVDAVASIYAPRREQERKWRDELEVVTSGELWFWAGIVCGAGSDDNDDPLSPVRHSLINASHADWNDNRLHTQLIRQAPVRAAKTRRCELMAHPVLRLGSLKYTAGSLEQQLVLRFLDHRCTVEAVESEEDCFTDPLTLAQWVRDARTWAEELMFNEPDVFAGLVEEVGQEAIERNKAFYAPELREADSLDATIALMAWARRERGFEASSYRAQAWEFLVHVADAALWLGWLFPRRADKLD